MTLFVISGYRAGLAKVPPMYWPTLGRREAHPRAFRAGQDAPTGAHGDRGRFPTDKDSRANWGSLRTSSAFASDSVTNDCVSTLPGRKHKCHCPQKEAKLYSCTNGSRLAWSSSPLIRRTWTGSGMEIPRRSSILSPILNSFCALSCVIDG